MYKGKVVILIFLAVALTTVSYAKEIKFKTIRLTAREIEFDGKKNCFVATGAPKLQTEDAKATSDKISSFLDAKGDIERLEMEGDVEIKMIYSGKTEKGEKIQRDVQANCNKAVMLRKEDKIILTGAAKVTVKSGEEGQWATLVSPRITIFIGEDRIRAEEEGTELTIQIKSEGE